MPTLLHAVRRWHLLGLVACGGLEAAAVVGLALLTGQLVDGTLPWPARLTPISPFALYPLLGAALLWIGYARETLAERLSQGYLASVRVRLLRHVLAMEDDVRRERRRGHLLMRFIGDLAAIRNWIADGVAPLVVFCISAPLALATLFVIEVRMGLVAAGSVGCCAAAFALIARPLTAAYLDARRRRARIAGSLGELLSEPAVIHVLGLAARELSRLRMRNRRLIAACVGRARYSGIVRGCPELAGVLATGALVYAMLEPLRQGDTSLGTLMAGLGVFGFLLAPLRLAARAFDYFLEYRVAVQRLQRILELPAAPRGAALPQPASPLLCFEQVTSTAPPLTIDAVVQDGDKILVCGPGGCGKTSLFRLALGLRRPASGRILVAGAEIRQLHPAARRRLLGVVSDDLPVFAGTVRSTLAMPRRSELPATAWPLGGREKSVTAVLREALLADEWPAAARTRVAEGARNLPRAQRFRLAVARALRGDPRVLLLDDLAPGDDLKSRALITRLLQDPERAVLYVTGDPGLRALATRVWRIEGGRVREEAPAAQAPLQKQST